MNRRLTAILVMWIEPSDAGHVTGVQRNGCQSHLVHPFAHVRLSFSREIKCGSWVVSFEGTEGGQQSYGGKANNKRESHNFFDLISGAGETWNPGRWIRPAAFKS